MELSEGSIHDVIHPTAAFCDYRDNVESSVFSPHATQEIPWLDSPLNPKNRIESLEVPREPLWDIDGCTAFGSQFYATPLFVSSPRPLRVDVFIPEPSKLPSEVRELLDVDAFFHTRDKDRIAALGLSRHILRILHYWASTYEDPRTIYENLPFGSRIVIRNVPYNIREAEIIVAPAHALERQLLSISNLRTFWGNETEFPTLVDIDDVVYISQLHDSVCLVKLHGRVWIFKALTSFSKYLYHELHHLLRIAPHPNVIARPAHLITKECSFGGKFAVLGFTTEYHSQGSLRDLIPFLELHRKVSLADKAKWGVQLSSALLHVRETTKTYYPDLRLDNIVLSDTNDIVMVDFEQRGVWCEFAAPEVNAIDYLRLLAVDEEIPTDVSERYANILSWLLPDWQSMCDSDDYCWPSAGYNVAWHCLTPTEQEYCEVYMLGRVLWCIFEAKSAPQRAAAWLSYRWEPIIEFPAYTITPEPMRDLIDRCTKGRRPGLSKYIVRDGNQLVLRHLEHTGRSTAQEVQETAKKWWSQEIDTSEAWLRERHKGMKEGTWNENYYDRPSLWQVHAELQEYHQQIRGSVNGIS